MENKYRYINSVRDEGFQFHMVLKYIAHFFTTEMRAQIRNDGPDTLIKYGRDWEYPWVLIKSRIKPNYKTLDCGSGYSPIPFIWATYGAEVHAIDRDILFMPRIQYVVTHCIPGVFYDFVKLFKIPFRKKMKNQNSESIIKNIKHKTSIVRKIINYVNALFNKMWKSDFWGPLPPKMLNKYNVNYIKGDFTELPYDDASFNVVSCVSVLEHMSDEDQMKGIREMSRVVKKDGILIITYDKHDVDLTDRFVTESGMKINELAYFKRPESVYNQNEPDIIGICLIKS